MKKIIREGVFETNSSSTHSVVFKKKTDNSVDKSSSYEIHTPWGKTLFLIGLINYAETYSDNESDEKTMTLEEVRERFGEDWTQEMAEIVFNINNDNKTICQKFKNAVIEEYLAMTGITREEFDKKFNESPFTHGGQCFCYYFFEEGVLDWCDCPFDSLSGIVTTLDLTCLRTPEDFKAKAKEYLSDEYKFALKEFYSGVMQVGNGEIY